MLSLRGRQERGSGLRAMACDDELEEGEACSDDEGVFFDPDVALSYIDEKIQHVLGHFQKDFEGGVCAENLGSKFGGYGSFLPTYQRSPSGVANVSTSRSPYQQSAERMGQNLSTVAVESISLNNGNTAPRSKIGGTTPSSGNLYKKERCSSTNGEKDSVAGSDSLDSSLNGSDQKKLKVRIKVASNYTLPRKNASIYSGLGLDISSSSSMEGSPDDLEGLSPEFSNMPHESPQTILEVMTCFSVPGGFLLSPLRGNILQLTNKVAPLLKKWETHLDEENLSRTYEGDSEPPLPVGHFRGQVAKKIKSGSKKRKSIGTETRKKLDYSSAIMNKEVKIDTQACEVIISDTPNIPSSSGAPATELKGVGHFAKESTKNACISRSYQQNVDVLDEQKDGNDLPTAKAEVMKEATNHMKNGNFDNSGSAYQAKGKVVKTSKVHMGLEERNRTSHKYSPLDGKKESRVKSEKTNEAAIVDFEGINEDRKDCDVGPYDNLKKAPDKEIFFGDWDRRENLPIKSQGEKERNMLENRSAQSELRQKEKMRNDNSEEKFDMSWAAKKEIPPSAKQGKFPASGEQQMHIPSTSGIATTTAAPLPAPVVIEENWVCCDMCQKWRLLPYGTNPSMLPKKWKCSMLNWLPGMNKCDISEDKTTNALNALYVTHGSATDASSGGPHTAAAATLPSSTYNISGQLEHSSKRKNAPRGGNDLVESSYPTPSSNRLMSNEQAPIRNKRTIDGEHCPFERDSVSKSADFAVEKQKSKHKKHSSYSGDPTEKSKKHSKFKNRTGIVEDEHRTSKKTKKEDEQYFARDWNHEYDLAGGKVHAGKTLHEKVKNTKSPSEQGDISLRKEKNSSRYDLFENPKRLCDEDIFRKEKKDHPADVEGSDLSENEKMSKERKEIQHNSMDHASKEAKNENSKERKLKIIKSEEMMSKVDSRHVLSSAEARLNNELVADNKFVTGKEASSELWENLPRRQAVDLAEPNKRDVAYLQSSTVATSSSSKISSSRRNKNSQEAKDSPVESVSSSPRRTFNIEKLSHGGMTALNDEQVRDCDENQDAGEPTMRSSLHGSSGSNSKELAQSTHTQVSDVTHLERGLENNPPKASWRKELAANDPCEVRGDNHLCSGDKKGLGTHGPSPHYQQKPFDPMATTFDIESDPIALESKNVAPSHQCKNGSSHFLSNGTKQSDMPSGKDKSQPRISNQDTQKRMAQVARSHTKEGKSEVHSSPLKSDTSKMKAHLRMPNVENGEQHGTGRKAISSPSDAGSPIRKDGSMVAFALKEARDLKHMANHLKSKGQELESTGLYFEAALKFLHVASLLENPTFDSSKPGDAARPMKMYSDTAKLCDFCAHAYEQCKKMAAAALAYKCVEVAYLKAAYYKYPSASKDRQELQAVVQIASGESPSSSASDIDNLNGHGASKALLTKGGNSPQVASSNLLPLAVRNQAHLLRLLAYTNDVNCAFDATRKSEVAIASAASSQDSRKGVDDGLASVRTVLDLNFNNVSELLRLVRLSMEAISS